LLQAAEQKAGVVRLVKIGFLPHSCASQRYRRNWDREFESGLLQRGVRNELLIDAAPLRGRLH
ncbi:MAG TPA: hypothetical protein VGG82_16735, partial [Casimicrobiaceae bacterium]